MLGLRKEEFVQAPVLDGSFSITRSIVAMEQRQWTAEGRINEAEMRAATDGAIITNRNVEGTTPPVERLCQLTIAEIKNTKNNVSFSASKNV